MGLDTYVELKTDEEVKEFVRKCEEYAKKEGLEPKDFDVGHYDFEPTDKYWALRNGYSWGSCHSRILLHDLEKVYFGEDANPFMHPLTKLLKGWSLHSIMYRDLTAEETKKLGELCIQLIDAYLEALPDDHTIPNGYMITEDGLIPGGGMNTKEQLQYCKKQARWFKMVGELGYGTVASY